MRSAPNADIVVRLRRIVDWTPYEVEAGDAVWLRRLCKLSSTRSAVLALLGPSGLGVDKVRPALDPAAVYLVGLTDFVHSRGQSVGISLPPCAPQMPLLLAATAVLADTLHEASGHLDKRRGVLLVSPDLGLRSRYCALTVDREALEAAHPGSRMRPDGTRVALAKKDGLSQGGVCFFLPAGPLPQSIRFKPGLVLLDLRYARWAPHSEDFARWARLVAPSAGLLALYTHGDRDTSQALQRAQFLEFPWDHAAVAWSDKSWSTPAAGDGPAPSTGWDMTNAPAYLDRSHRIVEIRRPETATKLVNGIARLLSEHDNVDAPDLRRSRWLLAVMQQLAVPVTWYEQTARELGRSTIRRMIARLGSVSLNVPEGLGPVIQTLRLTFEQLYQGLEADNPRARDLVIAIRNNSQCGRILVLVRDKVIEQAARAWLSVDALSDVDWLNQVNIRGCPRFESHLGEEFDSAIINGPLPRRYRWIVGARLPRQVTFLCYAEESDVVESQLESFYDATALQFGERTREEFLAKAVTPDGGLTPSVLSVTHLMPALKLVRPARPTVLDKPARKQERFQTVEGGLEGLRAALEQALKEGEELDTKSHTSTPIVWSEDTSDEESPPDDVDDRTSAEPDDVYCLVLRVTSRSGGEGRLFLQVDVPVEYVRLKDSTDIKKALPQQLRAGDVILRVEDGRRSGLFDRIVDLAEIQPRMQHLGAYRKKWSSATTRLAQVYSDGLRVRYDRMLIDLKAAGAPIETELALRWWIQGLVIGPEKNASIAAVGTVIQDQTLVDGARQFDKAFRQIRGIHQGIGRRLSTAIRRSFAHLDFEALSAVHDDLDEALALPLDELLETVDLAEVIAVGEPQAVAPHVVGRFVSEQA